MVLLIFLDREIDLTQEVPADELGRSLNAQMPDGIEILGAGSVEPPAKARVESVSYRAVLERGFALVTGAPGTVRRPAVSLKVGEALRLSFADGEAKAIAGGGAKTQGVRARNPRRPSKGPQGNLF